MDGPSSLLDHVPRQTAPWALSVAEVTDSTGVDPANGLTDGEAAHRLVTAGPNVIATERARSLAGSVFAQLRETMILVLLASTPPAIVGQLLVVVGRRRQA